MSSVVHVVGAERDKVSFSYYRYYHQFSCSMSDTENDTQTNYLEEVAEVVRVERMITEQERTVRRKEERLRYLRELREQEERLDYELQLAEEEMVGHIHIPGY